MNGRVALSAYLEEATTWDVDRVVQMERNARVAWKVAVSACVCVVGLAAALVVMLPLKRIEPYLIRVDSRTGAVDVVPVYRGSVKFTKTIARYFLMRYITVCERFDYALAEVDYEQCGAFNSSRLNQALYVHWAKGNPRSPLNTHRDGSTVVVHIEAVSFLGSRVNRERVAQVRYERITRQANGATQDLEHWIATMTYRFGGTSSNPQVRRWNPLGFRVIALEREREMLGTGSVATDSKR